MYSHDYHKRIRYGETDKMGFLYYGNYPLLYEIGRSEMIRSLGVSYQQMEDEHHIMMPVVAVESRYKRSIYYDENIKIRTILNELPSKMITFYHEIYNEADILVHTGMVKLFFVDKNTNNRVSAPAFLIEKLKRFFDA